jgi:hypothetical protein
MKAPIRLVIDLATPSDPDPLLSYIIIEGGKVVYVNGEDQPKPLSHIAAGKAVDLRFALEDCRDAAAAIKQLKKRAPGIKVSAWKLT